MLDFASQTVAFVQVITILAQFASLGRQVDFDAIVRIGQTGSIEQIVAGVAEGAEESRRADLTI